MHGRELSASFGQWQFFQGGTYSLELESLGHTQTQPEKALQNWRKETLLIEMLESQELGIRKEGIMDGIVSRLAFLLAR